MIQNKKSDHKKNPFTGILKLVSKALLKSRNNSKAKLLARFSDSKYLISLLFMGFSNTLDRLICKLIL